ncbi:MAG: hypothetical protein A2284_03545 [Deltaproteobacteria bacterium RIFOXYA12_FULL_61_11]|nr:MAG: hypothetical protein A2284_03545 [Deltaproteobacteria bacterium RIFOXYA12_FULL_61_11]
MNGLHQTDLPRTSFYVQRRSAARERARVAVAARTSVGLTPEQQALLPLAPPASTRSRLAVAGAALLASLLTHGAIVGLGLVAGKFRTVELATDRDVRIDMRVPEPLPPPPPPPKDPRPRTVRPDAPAPTPVAPPPSVEPLPPPSVRPRRIVGLSLSSTAADGSGPTFTVGNTRLGTTPDIAASPELAAKEPPPPEKVNRVASRLPLAGVKYTLPKRKRPSLPAYPELLKRQGFEADVTVLVSLDASGRVLSVKLIKEAPYPEFNEAARLAALAEEFEPALRDGAAVPYTLSFTYRFRLEDQ